MKDKTFIKNGKCYKLIFRPYITKKGKRIYPKKGKVFPLKVEVPCDCKKAS